MLDLNPYGDYVLLKALAVLVVVGVLLFLNHPELSFIKKDKRK